MFYSFNIPNQILWLVFLVTAVAVVYCSNQMSKYVAGISEKTSLGGAFLGAFVLSLVTSIPELVSGITSSLIDNPIQSYGNVIGVNMMTLTFLCFLDIIFIKKALFSKVSKTNKKTIIYVFGFNVLLLICLLFPKINSFKIPLGFTYLSPTFIIMFALYVIYIYRVYKLGKSEDDEEAESSGCENLPLWKVVVRFLIFSILLIGLSIVISNVTDQMALPVSDGGYGLGQAIAGSLFLSLCTGLPEMTSAISLAKMGQGNMALGGIIGSHFFNFLIFFFGDLAFSSDTTLNYLTTNSGVSNDYMTIKLLVIVGMVLNLLLFANTFKKSNKNKFLYIFPCVIIIALYVIFYFTKDNLVSLFVF